MAVNVSWGLPSGVRNLARIQNCAASHVAQNQSRDSLPSIWSRNGELCQLFKIAVDISITENSCRYINS